MRIAGMLVLTAAVVPAIVGSPAWAAFVEVSFDLLDTQLFSGESVTRYRLYANFSSEHDRLVAVRCGSAEGTDPFYQHPIGTWTEPSGPLLPIFPDLDFDTFITIGLLSLQPGQVATVIAEGSTFGAAEFQAGWSAPVDAAYTHGPSVLIAQLTFPSPSAFAELHFAMEWIDESGRMHESCMSLLLDWDVTIPCSWPHRADFNHDCVVNGFDLAILLGLWGVNEECEAALLPWDCPGDLTCGPTVDGADLAALLAEWGPVSDCQLGG